MLCLPLIGVYMTIEEVEKKLKLVYRINITKQKIPKFLYSDMLIHYSNEYFESARILLNNCTAPTMPYHFVLGHSIELAIKSLIVAKGKSIPRDHDLIILFKQIELENILFSELELSSVIHLHNVFFGIHPKQQKYLARYPDDSFIQSSSVIIPGMNTFSNIREKIINKAKSYNELSLNK